MFKVIWDSHFHYIPIHKASSLRYPFLLREDWISQTLYQIHLPFMWTYWDKNARRLDVSFRNETSPLTLCQAIQELNHLQVSVHTSCWCVGTSQDILFLGSMMTSSNGNIFRVTGHLCGEFTGPRWIPHTKASDAELWCLLWSAPE